MMDRPPPLDLTEALKDSPRFRNVLRQHDLYLSELERKLMEVIRLCSIMVDFGKSYVAAFANMMICVQDLNMFCFGPGSQNHTNFSFVTRAYADIVNYNRVLVEQAHWSIVKNLNDFVQRELAKVRNVRAQFEKVSHSLDEALIRNAQVNRQREQECTEVRNELTAVGTCFAHTALDYVYHMNLLIAEKDPEIMEAFVSFLRACRTFFHQGEDTFKDWDEHEATVATAITHLKGLSKATDRKMLDRHMLVPKEIFQHPTGMSPEPDIMMEGYLFKRATNAFKTWHRRWFVIRDHKLMYCHRDVESSAEKSLNRVTDDGYTVMENDLRLCLVRPAAINFERLSCFELVTPTKSHMLQADSQSVCSAWIKALKRSIEDALHDHDNHPTAVNTPSGSEDSLQSSQSIVSLNRSPSKTNSIVESIIRTPGCDKCADCGCEKPMWASINLGVVLCIECCGIHRSLGVQVSKVRSLTLDEWEPEHIKLIQKMGNTKVNEIYLNHWNSLSVPPPAKPNSNRCVRDAWIRSKYADRAFCRPTQQLVAEAAVNLAKRKGISASKLPSVLKAAVKGKKKLLAATRDARTKSVADYSTLASWVVAPGMGSLDSAHSSRSTPDLFISNSDEGGESPRTIFKRLSSTGSDTTLNNSGIIENLDMEIDFGCPENAQEVCDRLGKMCKDGDLLGMCKCLALGGSINGPCTVLNSKTTPVNMAVLSPSPEVTLEYLLLNGAKCDVIDGQGNTPLHIAVQLGLTGCVCILVKRGASTEVKNDLEQSPLDIAVNNAHADIVTLLRVCKLRDGDENAEYLSAMDDTVAGVFSDISKSLARNSAGVSKTAASFV